MLIGAGCATGPLGSSDNGSSACPECIALKTMVQEYDANRLRAESKYPGRRFDVAGKIVDIREGRRNLALIEVEVGVKARDLTLFTEEEFEYQVTTVMPFKEWSDWIIEKSTGDSVEANCLVKGFKKVWSLPGKTYGVPRLDECRRVDRQSIGKNGPTPTPFIVGVSPKASTLTPRSTKLPSANSPSCCLRDRGTRSCSKVSQVLPEGSLDTWRAHTPGHLLPTTAIVVGC